MLFSACQRAGRALPVITAELRAYSALPNGPNHAILEMLKSSGFVHVLLPKHALDTVEDKDEETNSPKRNVYKVRAFTSAIKVIGDLDHPIRSAAEAKTLKGIGPGIARRIQDFLEASGYVHVDPVAAEFSKRNRRACEELEQITGIGPVKARDLVAAGCMSIEQLRTPQFMNMLSNSQCISVKYFHHVAKRVTRLEAETVAQFIRDTISPKYEVIIGGSYRRGAPTSSDIDIIIFHPDHVHVPFPDPPAHAAAPSGIRPGRKRKSTAVKLPASLLQVEVVPALENRAILAAALSSGDLKWQGVVLVPESSSSPSQAGDRWGERQRRMAALENEEGDYRRMDLNLVAQKSRGAALLAFTGDTEFNRDLRVRASKIGMHLNEFGLWRWNESWSEGEPDSGSNRNGNGDGFWELVRAETEEEVLRELGMAYVEPVKRNFSLVLGKSRGKKKMS